MHVVHGLPLMTCYTVYSVVILLMTMILLERENESHRVAMIYLSLIWITYFLPPVERLTDPVRGLH